MTRAHWRRRTRLIATAGSSVLFAVCASGASAASTTTYKAGGVRFQAAFPSTVTMTNATQLFSGMPGLVTATIFAPAATANDLSSDIWKPNEFAVEVIIYKSTAASKAFFQAYGTGGPFKKETFDGRSAYGIAGNAAPTFLNSGTGRPLPDKSATGGLVWVLDRKSIFEAWSITTTSSLTTSFFHSLKILS